ncbi:MAG: hypothetical protein ACREET_17075 [Stellaceae bacterium]
MASIARTYDCSPPAISYIVSRTRARSAPTEAAPPSPVPASETHLVKSRPAEPPPAWPLQATPPQANPPQAKPPQGEAGAGFSASDSPPAPPSPVALRDEPAVVSPPARVPPSAETPPFRPPSPQLPAFLRDPPRSGGNGTAERQGRHLREPAPSNGSAARPFAAAAPPPSSGEPRGRLHLSLPHGGDGAHEPDPPPRPVQNAGFADGDERFDRRGGGAPPPRSQQGYAPPSPPPIPTQYPRSANGPPAHGSVETERGGEGALFIGRPLRERVDGDIAAFLAAFDAALDHDTVESRTELREATDRLLRAGARTRIELERLEARVPLSSRDRGGQPPFTRQR